MPKDSTCPAVAEAKEPQTSSTTDQVPLPPPTLRRPRRRRRRRGRRAGAMVPQPPPTRHRQLPRAVRQRQLKVEAAPDDALAAAAAMTRTTQATDARASEPEQSRAEQRRAALPRHCHCPWRLPLPPPPHQAGPPRVPRSSRRARFIGDEILEAEMGGGKEDRHERVEEGGREGEGNERYGRAHRAGGSD